MKIKHNIIKILIIGLLITSCIRPEKYVIETDFSKLMPDTINGEIQEESNKKSQDFNIELISNTVGRTIPDIEIFTVTGEKLNLRSILVDETIIVATDSHCGWGLENLTNDFPKAIKQIKNPKFSIICLLKRYKSDLDNPESFNRTLNELKLLYNSVFIINDNESKKINLFPNPTRLYINKDKIVKHIGMGTPLVENQQLKEIKENTGAHKNYTP